jgi:hypothetical protein
VEAREKLECETLVGAIVERGEDLQTGIAYQRGEVAVEALAGEKLVVDPLRRSTLRSDKRLYFLLKSASGPSLSLHGFFRESGGLLEPPAPLVELLRNTWLKFIVLKKFIAKVYALGFYGIVQRLQTHTLNADM